MHSMYFTQDPKLSDLGPVWDKQERKMSKAHFTFLQPPYDSGYVPLFIFMCVVV